MPRPAFRARMRSAWVVAGLLALISLGWFPSSVQAATVTVTNSGDEAPNTDGDCTLREAVQAANTNLAVDACPAGSPEPIVDIINVPADTYGLTSAAGGQLQLVEAVSIVGAGAGTTIIDGGGVGGVRVFQLSSADVAISAVTIRNGSADGGGGILVDADATLALTSSTVSGNTSTSGTGGGGIYVNGTATVSGGAVSGNSSSGGVEGNHGGGISVSTTGVVTLTGVTVSGNTATPGFGGGIDVNGTATIAGGTVSGNTSGDGGGISIGATGTATLTGVTVSGNTASGGVGGGIIIDLGGTATLTGVTVSGNNGGNTAGGMYVGGAATLAGVTVSGNTAGDGGGIYLGGTGSLTMRNSTVSGNAGGGLLTNSSARIEFSTITNNTTATGGAGLRANLGTVDLFASIIALNNGDECDTPDGSIDSEGSNLSSDGTCSLDQPSDRPNIANPMLGTLAGNGGPTQTHALLAGSAAIDAVQLVAQQLCPGTDQRGITRPQDGDGNATLVCDIGAYEFQLAPPTASITDVTVTEGNSGTVDAVFTVALSRASTGTATVAYATANGTATVVSDYQAATGTVTFVPGDTSETITVRVVGDTIDEPNETFFVNLTAPVGATIADAQGIGLILDDEGPIVTPAPTPAAAQLPNTGTGDAGLGGWGAFGALLLVLISASAWPRVRRRVVRAR